MQVTSSTINNPERGTGNRQSLHWQDGRQSGSGEGLWRVVTLRTVVGTQSVMSSCEIARWQRSREIWLALLQQDQVNVGW